MGINKLGTAIEYKKDGVLRYAGTTTDSDVNEIHIEYAQFQTFSPVTLRTDWIFVRQYTSPEPTTILDSGLVLTMSGPTDAPVGQSVTYTLIIQSYEAMTASNVVVTQTLPTSIDFYEASPSPDQTDPLVWNLGDLGSLGSRTLTITGTVHSTATVGTSLVSTATVASELTETDLTDNTTSFTTTIVPGPAADLVMTAPADVDLLIPFDLAVTAYDAYGNIAVGYTGLITVTTSDASDDFPINHSFVLADQGIYTFTDLVLKSVGIQLITATDGTLITTTQMAVDDLEVVVDQDTTWRNPVYR